MAVANPPVKVGLDGIGYVIAAVIMTFCPRMKLTFSLQNG
jgi:hypothetical protein